MESSQGDLSHITLNILLSVFKQGIAAGEIASALTGCVLVVILLACAAAVAGSENAFFSLTHTVLNDLREQDTRSARSTIYLLSHPKKLLATILIANSFVSVGVVIISSYVVGIIFDFSHYPVLGFVIQVIVITFMIVLVGEVLPKIYGVQNSEKLARWMAFPMVTLSRALFPFVYLLEKSTSVIDKRITKKGHMISIDELNHAIDITSEKDAPEEEKEILKSIVNFGNISVKEIMKPRMDVVSFDKSMRMGELVKEINEWGYSRIPVYDGSFDKVLGVLYIKDLLPHLTHGDDYNWQKVIKPPYFVPESKKIDNLLKEFQSKRVHLAIVVDEFGGTSGIVTMEDILEEIFGEIKDEFDEDDFFYSKLDNSTYVFEAKTMLNDMCRIMEIADDSFDDIRGDSDTLGGLILELTGKIPNLKQKIDYEHFTFTIEAVDKRKIKRVKVNIQPFVEG